MRAFFQITDPQNQEDNFDPHEPQVLFLVTPGKQDYLVQAAPRNLSDLEKPPKSPENEWVLTYIKTLATYMSDRVATSLVFTRGAEASALVFGKDLYRLRIQNEASHGSLVQDK